MKKKLEEILKYSQDLQDAQPEKSAFWHLIQLRSKLTIEIEEI